MPLNIKIMCRLCMSNQGVNLYDIFADDAEELDPKAIFQENLAMRIQTMMALEVSVSDGLSRYICSNCIYLVNRFFLFRQTCLEAMYRTKKILETITGSKEGSFSSCNVNDGEEMPILVYENYLSGGRNAVDPLALPDEIREEPHVRNCPFTAKNNLLPKKNNSSMKESSSSAKKQKSSVNKKATQSSLKRSKSPAKKQTVSSNLPNVSEPKAKKQKLSQPTTGCNSTEGQGDTDILSSAVNDIQLNPEKMISKTGVPLKYEEHPCGRPNPSSYIKFPEMPTEGYEVHLQNGTYACKICGKVFNHKSSLKRHFVTHSNAKPYQCQICERHFTDSSNLVKHIRYVHNENKRVVCSICKKEYKNPSALTLHKEREHRKPKKDQEKSSTTTLAEYKCDVCSYTGVSASELMDHKNTHGTTPVPSCSVVTENTGVPETSTNHVTAVSTETSVSDPFHNAVVTDFSSEYPIICQICLSGFKDNESLDAHKTVAHTIPKYQCPYCPEGFMLKKKQEKHIKAVHDPKEFTCKICSKSFSNEFTFNLHEQTHSNSRSSRSPKLQEECVCEFCHGLFPSNYALYIHKETCGDLFAVD